MSEQTKEATMQEIIVTTQSLRQARKVLIGLSEREGYKMTGISTDSPVYTRKFYGKKETISITKRGFRRYDVIKSIEGGEIIKD